jgi:hypothetical protein
MRMHRHQCQGSLSHDSTLRSKTVAGCVGRPSTPGVFWRGLRTVAVDATSLHVPDRPAVTARYRKRDTDKLRFGYPIRCGSVCWSSAAPGDPGRDVRAGGDDGESTHAGRLLHALSAGMLVLADAGYDSWELLRDIAATKAEYLCRSGARRTPLILTEWSDGSVQDSATVTCLDPDRHVNIPTPPRRAVNNSVTRLSPQRVEQTDV